LPVFFKHAVFDLAILVPPHRSALNDYIGSSFAVLKLFSTTLPLSNCLLF